MQEQKVELEPATRECQTQPSQPFSSKFEAAQQPVTPEPEATEVDNQLEGLDYVAMERKLLDENDAEADLDCSSTTEHKLEYQDYDKKSIISPISLS